MNSKELSKEGIRMLKAYIRINSYNDIKRLHELASSCSYDLIIESGIYKINPKSIMGMLGLGTKKTVALVARDNDKKGFVDKFGDFISE